MTEQHEIIFSFEKNLNNNIATYSKLIELYHTLNALEQQKVILDLSNITFLSANLLALLGCCVDSTMTKRNHKIALRNLHPKIKAVMQKNGFNRYFTWDNLDDKYHNTMNYDIFESTTEHLVDFERYLLPESVNFVTNCFPNIAYFRCLLLVFIVQNCVPNGWKNNAVS